MPELEKNRHYLVIEVQFYHSKGLPLQNSASISHHLNLKGDVAKSLNMVKNQNHQDFFP